MTASLAIIVVVMVVAYLLGSIPFGLLLTKLAGQGDIRAIGSGNIGATNVLRTGKKSLAAATLLLDMLKGTAAVMIAQHFAPGQAVLAALLALLGHMYPVWLRFNGGKGVATMLGVMLALHWPIAVIAMFVWLATALILRISSVAALTATATMPIFIDVFNQTTLYGVVFIFIVLIFMKHSANIRRLLDGTEPRIGEKKPDDEKANVSHAD